MCARRFAASLDWTKKTVLLATTALTVGACGVDRSVGPTTGAGHTQSLASKQSTTNSTILFEKLFETPAQVFQIFSMDEDGTGIRELTNWSRGAQDAQWAPDGKRIVFDANAGDGNAIYIANADGTGFTKLTNPPAASFCSDFAPSPVGKQIGFQRLCLTGGAGVYVMNTDGTALTLIMAQASEPSGSKLGQIAFVLDNDIWVMDLATGGRTNVTSTTGIGEFGPAFAPSGKQIAFVRTVSADNAEAIFVMQADGTQMTQVTPASATGFGQVRWSPDGKQLMYSQNGDVYTMNADGTGVTNITNTPNTTEYGTAWAR